MRICFLADAGSWNTKIWANYFADVLEHDVHVVSDRCFGGFSRSVTMHQIGDLKDLMRPPSKLGYVLNVPTVRRILADIRPDILVGYRVPSNGYMGSRTGFHPLVVVAQGQHVVAPGDSLVRRMFVRKAIREADLVHVWAGHMADDVVKMGASREKVLVCPKGIDLGRFEPAPVGDREYTVVATRTLHRRYNVDVILTALAEARARVSGMTAVIAGRGESAESLKRLAEDLDIADRVLFPGFVLNEELPELLAKSEIYVSAVPTDGVSSSLLEAVACGCFPIVADNGANRQWIEDGRNGFLVAAASPEAYADAIARAWEDRPMRERAADVNRRMVVERGDIGKNMKTIEARYLSLVEGGA